MSLLTVQRGFFLNADGNSLTVVFAQSIPKAVSPLTQVVKQCLAIATSSKLYRGSWKAFRPQH